MTPSRVLVYAEGDMVLARAQHGFLLLAFVASHLATSPCPCPSKETAARPSSHCHPSSALALQAASAPCNCAGVIERSPESSVPRLEPAARALISDVAVVPAVPSSGFVRGTRANRPPDPPSPSLPPRILRI